MYHFKHFHKQHPDVPLYKNAIDQRLDEHGYIIAGWRSLFWHAVKASLKQHQKLLEHIDIQQSAKQS